MNRPHEAQPFFENLIVVQLVIKTPAFYKTLSS